MTLLQPGSPAARIVHSVMSGNILTFVEDSDRELADAAAAAHYLAHRRDQMLIEFCTDTVAGRDRLLGRFGRAARKLPSPAGVRDWRHRVTITCPQEPEQWTSPEVAFIDSQAVRDPDTVAVVLEAAEQLVVVGPARAAVVRECHEHTFAFEPRHVAEIRWLWGEVPLEVILAGGAT